MPAEQAFLIAQVTAGSPADRAGLKAGDRLIRLDNKPIKDIIDYKILEADEKVSILVTGRNGRLRRVKFLKDPSTPLGLHFEPPTMAPLLRCRNNCLFCFVDQNPPGMRPSLYLKDDDYRLSFLYGNFITLNHLKPWDLERIARLRLSPLYISVHTTDPALRSRLFGSKAAGRGLQRLQGLLQAGVKVHAQVVLCPGLNTGEEMLRTINDLERMGPNLLSVAVIPVGLTCFRPDGSNLRRLTPREAAQVVETVTRLQENYLKKRGSRFVYPADELYNLAGFAHPPAEAYEGYPQLENGIGMARLFLDGMENESRYPGLQPARLLKVTLVTGLEAAALIGEAAGRLALIGNLEAEVLAIENRYFGPQVTVAGLLTGSDLIRALKGKELGEELYLSQDMLKDGDELFLDGTTLSEVAAALKVKIRAARFFSETISYIRELAASIAPAPASRR